MQDMDLDHCGVLIQKKTMGPLEKEWLLSNKKHKLTINEEILDVCERYLEGQQKMLNVTVIEYHFNIISADKSKPFQHLAGTKISHWKP